MTMTITWHAHEPPPASSFPSLTWWQACDGAVSTQDLWPGPMQVWGCCCGSRISWLVLTKRGPGVWRRTEDSHGGRAAASTPANYDIFPTTKTVTFTHIGMKKFIVRRNACYTKVTCSWYIFKFSFLIDVWITSQTMMKLNPMKSPRTPPQSATSDPIEYASSSFSVRMDGLSNFIKSCVVFGSVICSGLPTTWKSCSKARVKLKFHFVLSVLPCTPWTHMVCDIQVDSVE